MSRTRIQQFYEDGITRISDPFWSLTCQSCGEYFWSCICIATCPRCGKIVSFGTLGKRTYEEVIAERGNPIVPEWLKNQTKSD